MYLLFVVKFDFPYIHLLLIVLVVAYRKHHVVHCMSLFNFARVIHLYKSSNE